MNWFSSDVKPGNDNGNDKIGYSGKRTIGIIRESSPINNVKLKIWAQNGYLDESAQFRIGMERVRSSARGGLWSSFSSPYSQKFSSSDGYRSITINFSTQHPDTKEVTFYWEAEYDILED